MPRKTYTEQFKRDVVSLYESTPGATINAIASDLGVNRNSLRTWLDAFGTGTKTNANGEKVASPIAAPTAHALPRWCFTKLTPVLHDRHHTASQCAFLTQHARINCGR
ncbi:transposase [Corynebacterium guangdongense]|uniref:Transposase-like protein n=1 Tax=Corynebacterium guangdongense TaxID=1783348 RepID=A0ABU1ZY76_9CORY|nr:transposase [Corynebacterium guangdongense]MDR7329881.1 transposase-like protein [Corynebacterium guangdongense]WJZ18444.1 Transposase [Corynebacterium guangdongense]